MKIRITYQDEAEEREVLQLLKPILKGAKIKKRDTYKPYFHTYIATKNSTKPCENKKNS